MRLHHVEQGIKTHRVVMNDVDIERSETIRWIEARFAHRAIALIKQRSQRVRRAIVVFVDVVISHLMRLVILFHQIVVRLALGIAFPRYHFGRRSFSEIPVARQTTLRSQVWLSSPQPVILLDLRQSLLKIVRVVSLPINAQASFALEKGAASDSDNKSDSR